MAKDLTSSNVERQNVLNNPYAVQKIEQNLALGGVIFEGEAIFTKAQVADLLQIDERTVERYLSSHGEELNQNGYRLLRGKLLKDLVNSVGADINVGTKTTVLGVFSFRSLLNMAMLVTESDRARSIRSRILDIVIDVIAERAGGQTKYINQRDEEYLPAAYQEESFRQNFTDALDHYVKGNHWKYGKYTNRIYQSIFKENAKEYKGILKLAQSDKLRDTLYSEVLNLIASYEAGIAHELEAAFKRKRELLTHTDVEEIFVEFENHPRNTPLLNDARTKMASRDLHFRDALHQKLEHYIQTVPESDFERFLGDKSKALEERISETQDVFKRLKDR